MEEEGDRDSRGELRNIYFLEKREGGFTERNECSLRPVKYLEIPIITEDVVQLKQIGFHLYLTSKSTCFFYIRAQPKRETAKRGFWFGSFRLLNRIKLEVTNCGRPIYRLVAVGLLPPNSDCRRGRQKKKKKTRTT